MHIPDGFIPYWQCAIYYIILIIGLYFASKWARENLDEKRIPLLAVLAAVTAVIIVYSSRRTEKLLAEMTV